MLSKKSGVINTIIYFITSHIMDFIVQHNHYYRLENYCHVTIVFQFVITKCSWKKII